MNVIIKIKNFFRRRVGNFEIWDTSAISTWFDKFVEHVNKDDINVIVPEGVFHELSEGRRTYETCREAYNFINEARRLVKLAVYVTKDHMRSWKVDDQVVAIAYEYYKKGYNVTLITCDRDMANNAENRGLTVALLKGNRNQVQQPPQQQNVKEVKPQKETFENVQPVQVVAPQLNECVDNDGEPAISCVIINKVPHVNVKEVAVFDYRGKKKIGTESRVPVTDKDILLYQGTRYMLKAVKPTSILLKRMDSA